MNSIAASRLLLDNDIYIYTKMGKVIKIYDFDNHSKFMKIVLWKWKSFSQDIINVLHFPSNYKAESFLIPIVIIYY